MRGYVDLASPALVVPVGTGTTAVIAANRGRREITVINDHATQVVYLTLQSAAAAPTALANSGIRLNPAGGSYTSTVFRGAIAAISVGGTSNVLVTELQPVPQFARPDGVVSTGTFTAVGAANLAAALNEVTPNDTSYITSSQNADICYVSLSDFPDPGTDSGFTMRARCSRSAAAGALTMYLIQGAATTIASRAMTFGADGAWNLNTFALTAPEMAAVTDFTDLRFAWATANTLSSVSVSWAELESPGNAAIPVASGAGDIGVLHTLVQPDVYSAGT